MCSDDLSRASAPTTHSLSAQADEPTGSLDAMTSSVHCT